MVEHPADRKACDRRELASRWLPVVLRLAFSPPPRPAEDHPGASETYAIHGELLEPGFEISEGTVSRYLAPLDRRRDPGQGWLVFLKNHREAMAAMDFFTVPTVAFRVRYCFFVVSHSRRRILHFNATEYPTRQGIVQQRREAFLEDRAPTYLVLDRDRMFSGEVTMMLECLDSELIRTAYPRPLAERRGGALGRKRSPRAVGSGDRAE